MFECVVHHTKLQVEGKSLPDADVRILFRFCGVLHFGSRLLWWSAADPTYLCVCVIIQTIVCTSTKAPRMNRNLFRFISVID